MHRQPAGHVDGGVSVVHLNDEEMRVAVAAVVMSMVRVLVLPTPMWFDVDGDGLSVGSSVTMKTGERCRRCGNG